MGAFFKSFWGQLGRSSGKRVSNAIYGDKWATPYRVAVGKSEDNSRRQRGKNRSARQNRDYPSFRARKSGTPKRRDYRWVYWLSGFILFAGTYNAILHPTTDDVVLIIMLWVVALIYLSFKYFRSRS